MSLPRYQFSVTDEAGNVIPAAHVEVRREVGGQPLAMLFTDRAGTAGRSNPFNADAVGFAAFYTAPGNYQVRVYTGSSLAPTFERIWRFVSILDGEESIVIPVEAFALPGTVTPDWYGKPARIDQASGGNITLPRTALEGAWINFIVAGLGLPTFVPEAGASLLNRSGHTAAAGKGAMVALFCHRNVDGNSAEWLLTGDTA